MPFQSNQRVALIVKRETTTGTPAGTSGGDTFRITESPGFDPDRPEIVSAENRADGTTGASRLGSKNVPGSVTGELTIGGAIDVCLEAVMRSAWRAALQITQVTMTSITTTTTTIVAAGGSWITQGVRVGDIGRLTNHATAANNNINLRVLSVTASTLTVAGFGANAAAPLTTNAAADTAFEFTVLKKLVNPTSAATLIRYSHTVEQNLTDLDLSTIFLGCRVSRFAISWRPNSMATFTIEFVGLNWTDLVPGTSPYFTAPAVTTGLALIADDSAIRHNGADVGYLTGFDLEFSIDTSTEPTIGSVVNADVDDNRWVASGTVTARMQDYANRTLRDNETDFELSIAMQEPSATLPQPCLGFFMPRVKMVKAANPAGGGTGAMIETWTIRPQPKVAATGYDATTVAIFSSAP